METASTNDFAAILSLYQQERSHRESLETEVLKLRDYLKKALQALYGSKCERFVPGATQLALDVSADTSVAATDLSKAQKISYVKTNQPQTRVLPELNSYLEYLPRVYETREPAHIPDGAQRIGQDEHLVIESKPGEVFLRVVVIPKYKLPQVQDENNTQIIAATPPARPLAKCLAGSSLLAQIVTDKICDHLPVHRQHKRFERNGVSIPYNTLNDWGGKAIDLVSTMGPALLKEVIGSNYIHVDETGLKVLIGSENNKTKKVHNGYLWCYNNSLRNLMYFDYQPGRGKTHTIGILKDFRGIIQTDGWHVYEGVTANQRDIRQICCLAHARRKFFESKTTEKELAEHALTKFNALYAIERKCKEQQLSYDKIKDVRQREAVPILDELHIWMQAQYIKLLPTSPIRSAIAYSLERWERLCYYTNDGMLNPDNNPVERQIRPVALGRNNFLFAGSHRGAERLAIMYSLMGTCKLNNVNPYEWLKDVLDKLNDWPINKIHELLPHNWKRNKGQLPAG